MLNSLATTSLQFAHLRRVEQVRWVRETFLPRRNEDKHGRECDATPLSNVVFHLAEDLRSVFVLIEFRINVDTQSTLCATGRVQIGPVGCDDDRVCGERTVGERVRLAE